MKLETFTISLPAGTTNHSDPHLLCPPASWESIVVFFIGNYLTHAATVKLPPATPILANIWICFSALLMPATGLVFGLMAFSQAIKGRTQSELKNATLARALCMYVRTADWQSRPRSLKIEARVTESPRPAKPVESLLIRYFIRAYKLSKSRKSRYWSAIAILLVRVAAGPYFDQSCLFRMMIDVDHEKQRRELEDQQSNVSDMEMSISSGVVPANDANADQTQTLVLTTGQASDRDRRVAIVSPSSDVHGRYFLGAGYALAYVPINAIVVPLSDTKIPKSWKKMEKLSKSRNIAKSLVALLQLCFSVFVLIRSKGNQVPIYGYAAFSLTVAPYAVMAAVNLLANFCMPTYDCLYLVENDVMREIKDELDVEFEGVVGKVQQAEPDGLVYLESDGTQGSKRYISFPGMPEGTRFEMLTPDDAISQGKLPHRFARAYATRTIETSSTPGADSFLVLLGLILVAAPVAIVGALSRFDAGTSSTSTQRGVLMAWLGTGQLCGLIMAGAILGSDAASQVEILNIWSAFSSRGLATPELLRRLDIEDNNANATFFFKIIRLLPKSGKYYIFWPYKGLSLLLLQLPEAGGLVLFIAAASVYGFPAIWGFVVVVQMLKNYGNCIRVY